jgi:hypothetical protein
MLSRHHKVHRAFWAGVLVALVLALLFLILVATRKTEPPEEHPLHPSLFVATTDRLRTVLQPTWVLISRSVKVTENIRERGRNRIHRVAYLNNLQSTDGPQIHRRTRKAALTDCEMIAARNCRSYLNAAAIRLSRGVRSPLSASLRAK